MKGLNAEHFPFTKTVTTIAVNPTSFHSEVGVLEAVAWGGLSKSDVMKVEYSIESEDMKSEADGAEDVTGESSFLSLTAIIGCVVGGVVVLALVAVIVGLAVKRRQKSSSATTTGLIEEPS